MWLLHIAGYVLIGCPRTALQGHGSCVVFVDSGHDLEAQYWQTLVQGDFWHSCCTGQRGASLTHACMHVRTHACTHTCTHPHTHTHTTTKCCASLTHTPVPNAVPINLSLTHTHTHTHTHVHACMHTHHTHTQTGMHARSHACTESSTLMNHTQSV